MAIRLATFELELNRSSVVGVSGDEINLASGQSDLTPRTHEENLNAANGSMSTFERFRLFSQTRLGRLTMLATMALPPVIGLAGCGDNDPAHPAKRPPGASASASPNSEGRGGGDGQVLEDGDVLIITRTECVVTSQTLDNYAALAPAEQEVCQKEIAELSADSIPKLSPLSQTRWMAYYRKHVLDAPGAMIDIDLKTYDTALKEPASRGGLAGVFLLLHGNNIAALAWHLQQTDGRAHDPRTRWALLGPKALEDGEGFKQAKAIAGSYPARHMTLEQYVNAVPSRTGLLYDDSTVEDVTAAQLAGGAWEYSFTAAKKDGSRHPFRYRLMPYLTDDPQALSRGNLHEVLPPPDDFLGDALAILPVSTST